MSNIILTYLFMIINFYLNDYLYKFLLKLSYDRLLFEEYNIHEEINTFCDNSTSLACKNKYKKKKFILLISDGTSFDELPYNYKPEEHNLTSVFKNYDTEFKITGGNFETEFTGEFSRNYYYKKIINDNFFKQLHRSGYRLSYLGIDLPVFLFLGAEKNIELSKYKVEKNVEPIAFSNLCNYTLNVFDNKITNFFSKIKQKYSLIDVRREEIYKQLDELFKKENDYLFNILNLTKCFINQFDYNPNNKSEKFGIIYYTTTLDEIHHKYSKKHWKSIVNAYITNKFISKIHQFVNENTDFSLILIGDHGGSIFPGDETITMHGSNKKGNEAIFTLFNNELGKNYNELKYNIKTINRYNYAPTMPQIIEGINIPINSIGKPLLIGNDNIIRYAAVKSKEEQVIQFLIKGREKFNEFNKTFIKLENEIKKDQKDDISLFNDKYYNDRINKLVDIHVKAKGLIHRKSNVKHFVNFLILFAIYLIIFSCEFYIFKKIVFKVENEEKKDKNDFKEFIYIIIVYFIPIFFFYFFPGSFHIMTRLRFGFWFSNAIILLFFIFEKFNTKIKIIICIKILIFFSIMFIIFYGTLYYLKYYFSYYNFKILSLFIFYPLYLFFIYYDTKKELSSIYFDKDNRYSCQKIITILSIIFLIFILLFDLRRIQVNTKNLNIIKTFITFSFIILFIFNILIVLFGKGKKICHFPLTNLITFFLNIFTLDEAEKFCLIIFYPLCEIIIRKKENKNNLIKKLFYLIMIIFLCDIFNLYSRYVLTPKINITISLRILNLKIDSFLMKYPENFFYVILASYIHSLSNFSNKEYSNSESIVMRYLVYFKILLISLYSYFNTFIQKNQNELIYLIFINYLNKYFLVYDNFWIICFKLTQITKFYIIKIFKNNNNIELKETTSDIQENSKSVEIQ